MSAQYVNMIIISRSYIGSGRIQRPASRSASLITDARENQSFLIDAIGTYDDTSVHRVVFEVVESRDVVWTDEARVNRPVAIEPCLAFIYNPTLVT
jgi:hypothetical protein